jgi:hypothetical protein
LPRVQRARDRKEGSRMKREDMRRHPLGSVKRLPLTNCERWAEWTRRKWRELNRNQSLGQIDEIENLWVVRFDDTSRVCPFCGHVLLRPKSHIATLNRYQKENHR